MRLSSRKTTPTDVVSIVTEVLDRSLSDSSFSLEAAAEELQLKPWTLQRDLKRAGSSFAAIKDELKCERGKSLVRYSVKSMTEISVLLGYSDVSGFNRAFQKWTGLSPTEFRSSTSRDTSDCI